MEDALLQTYQEIFHVTTFLFTTSSDCVMISSDLNASENQARRVVRNGAESIDEIVDAASGCKANPLPSWSQLSNSVYAKHKGGFNVKLDRKSEFVSFDISCALWCSDR